MLQHELGYLTIRNLRDYQQDCYAICTINGITIMIVCDGNGGLGGYELAKNASKSCLATLAFDIAQGEHQGINSEKKLNEIGLNAINRAARQVRVLKDANDWDEAGTTITLVMVTQDHVACFWIGDSPAYMFDSKYLVQLNTPLHTLAERLIQDGQPRSEISKQPGLNSILTRCAGHNDCIPESNILKIVQPLVVLVGSDGVLDYAPKAKIIEALNKKLTQYCSIDETVHQIVNDAIDAKSDDNCTLLALHAFNSPKLVTRKLTRLYQPIF